MKKRKLLYSITSIVLLVAMCFTMTSCVDKDETDVSKEETVVISNNAFKTEFVNTEKIKLSVASPMTVTRGANTITQRISATVIPSTAENKKVDWSVTWGDETVTDDVSNYITVIPDTDGSEYATVTCKAAFSGNIIITATTRQNGYTADCIVTFVGIPSSISLSTNMDTVDGRYRMAVDNTYVFGVICSNPLGPVSEEYKNLEVVVRGTGRIKVASRERYEDGSVKWYEESVVDLNTITDKFVDVSFATDGTLNVTIKRTIESYFESVVRIDGGRTVYHKNMFRSMESECYFTVLITEPHTGVRVSFDIVIDPNAVTGVTVSKNEMLF